MRGVRCPSCGGSRFADLGSGWFECRSDVPYSGAPPELTGLPHAVIDFGPCKHRFEPSKVAQAEAAHRARARAEVELRAKAEAEEQTRVEDSVAQIEGSTDPAKILTALQVREGTIETAILKRAWLRLLADGGFDPPEEEIVTLEGRGTVLGYLLSRGTYTTQWGKWTESERAPVSRASGAGYRVVEAHYDSPGFVDQGYDLWLDGDGELWSDGRSTASPARLAIGNGGHRDKQRLVVSRGRTIRLQRRKAQWQGWEVRVPDAQSAWPTENDDAQYARAMKVLLSHHLQAA